MRAARSDVSIGIHPGRCLAQCERWQDELQYQACRHLPQRCSGRPASSRVPQNEQWGPLGVDMLAGNAGEGGSCADSPRATMPSKRRRHSSVSADCTQSDSALSIIARSGEPGAQQRMANVASADRMRSNARAPSRHCPGRIALQTATRASPDSAMAKHRWGGWSTACCMARWAKAKLDATTESGHEGAKQCRAM